tara:strand:- start:1284 stop:1997 length:714 start_codon:yes stop_codon:yes gene_type:complete
MNVFIQHDISKVKDISFMGYNIWNMIEWEKFWIVNRVSGVEISEKFPIFYIDIYSSEDHEIDSSISSSIQNIHPDAVIHFVTPQEYQKIQQRIISEGGIYIHLDSDVLLPQVIVRDKMRSFPSTEKNVWLPLGYHKYSHKEVEWKNKKYTVKSFIPCQDNFYDTDIILDWDERYYITHALFEKLKGALPKLSPSPLFHEWGQFIKIIANNNYRNEFSEQYDIILRDPNCFVYKFERV